jgi:hypothetical protein
VKVVDCSHDPSTLESEVNAILTHCHRQDIEVLSIAFGTDAKTAIFTYLAQSQIEPPQRAKG